MNGAAHIGTRLRLTSPPPGQEVGSPQGHFCRAGIRPTTDQRSRRSHARPEPLGAGDRPRASTKASASPGGANVRASSSRRPGASRSLKLATEGALWAAWSLRRHGGRPETSALRRCWVHAERHPRSAQPPPAAGVARIRAREPIRHIAVKIPLRQTGASGPQPAVHHQPFATLDRLLARLHANKVDAGYPASTNGSENDIRCQVTRRKIMAPAGPAATGFLGLINRQARRQPARRSRLDIPGAPSSPCQTSSPARRRLEAPVT